MITEAGLLTKPWQDWAGTCLKCHGPWTTFCLRGRCRIARSAVGQWPYECAVCGAFVTHRGPLPRRWDERGWKEIQQQHNDQCCWAQSRGYLLTA